MIPTKLSDISNDNEMMANTGMDMKEFQRLLPYFEQGYNMRHGILRQSWRNGIPTAFTDYGELMYMVLVKKKLGFSYKSMAPLFGIGSTTVEKYYLKGAKALEMAKKLSGNTSPDLKKDADGAW
jgi:hypothetical protein